MNHNANREYAIRKRLSLLWEVPPFKIDVELHDSEVLVQIDGVKPSPEQMSVFEEDLRAWAKATRQAMN